MSSSLEQRSSKGHEGHVPPANQTSKDVEYNNYMASQAVQGGYTTMNQMGQPQAVADPYMSSYYASYMPFQPTDASGGGWPTGRDAAAMSYGAAYAPMAAADYMTGRSMFGQYDYNWFPGFDYAGAWGASVMPVQQAAPQKTGRNEYIDPASAAAYYEVDTSGSAGVNGSAANVVGSVEQGMKTMRLNSDEDASGAAAEQQQPQQQQQQQQQQHSGGSSGYSAASRPTQNSAPPAKKSWANVASQPARPAGRAKLVPRAPVNMVKGDVGPGSGSWENKTGPGQARGQAPSSGPYSAGGSSNGSRTATGGTDSAAVPAGGNWSSSENSGSSRGTHSATSQYNPKEFDLNPKGARFFVIKSFSEDDIHRSIKYHIWCSTEYGNKRLDAAFREREGKGPIFLFFSVNGSGHFCGVAQMVSAVDYHKSAGVWAQDKWKGQFEVQWIYVKDVPNSQLRHIKLENNEGKPVTNSRDTQEVPPEKGKQVLRVIHQYRHTTSIFDDFQHYEKQQEESTKDQNGPDNE